MRDLPSNHMDNRAYNAKGINDSDRSVRQSGGELGNDPRRVVAQSVIDTKVRDHDMSGYNHNGSASQPSNFAREQEIKAYGMGTPHVDGTYSK